MLFLKNLLKEIFKDMLSIIQLSRFLSLSFSTATCLVYHVYCMFVKNFFLFIKKCVLSQTKAYLVYHLHCNLSRTFLTFSWLLPHLWSSIISFLLLPCNEDYLTITYVNCQWFICFLFISCNSDNSDNLFWIYPFYSIHILTMLL